MAPKTLEEGSKYAHFDKDGDGVITDEEFMLEREMMRAENEDGKEDQIRKMVVRFVGTSCLPYRYYYCRRGWL